MSKEILKVKGDKSTFADSEMKAFWRDDGLLEISKGFMALIFTKKQAKELAEWLGTLTEEQSK